MGSGILPTPCRFLNWLFAGGPEPVPIQAPPAERFTDHDDGTVT
jgi:hypothetical protein